MSQKPIPIGEIKKLADDIRLIKDFAENHNFDASLINASIGIKDSKSESWDLPMIFGGLFTALFVALIASLNFCDSLSSTASRFIFLLALLFAGLASACVHKRFDNLTITIISGSVLVVILLIGSGVFTPREAIDELQKLRQK